RLLSGKFAPPTVTVPSFPPPARGLSLPESPPPQADRARAATRPTTAPRISFFMGLPLFGRSGGTGGAEQPRRDDETAQNREDQLDDERQQHHEDRPSDDELVVVAGEPVDDVAAEAAEPGVGGDRRGGDHLDRGRAQPQQD